MITLRRGTVVAVCLFLSACGSGSTPGAGSSGGAQPPAGALPSKAAATATVLPSAAPALPPPAAPPLLAYLDGLDALTLRDLLLDDPTPALALLGHPHPHVQVCALTALQYRPKWRRAHAQILLQTAQHAVEPLVRAAALTALANLEDPILVGTLTQYLRDPLPEVRRAAAGAILWKPEKRWASVRHAVRAHLSDLRAARDGALPCLTTLPELAIRDLSIWASEIGAVGQRATLTLVSYYRRNISEEKSTGFARYLTQEMLDPSVPSAVRVEVAYMLREQNRIEPECFEAMLEASQPGALRLIAAEAILARNSNPQAVEVLKEIARQPNRELALAAAVIIQKALRIDLGLPLGEAPPLPQSKQAAEIIRKVKQWASQPDLRKVIDEESIDFDLPQVSSPLKR